jgi:hypothetical protein
MQDGSSRLIPGNSSSFDVVPLDFKSESSIDNTVLLATALGIYKIGRVPNKARFDEYGFGAGASDKFEPCDLLPGFGYTRALVLKGTDIYACGRENTDNTGAAVIWKNGPILKQLSPTGEAFSVVVR